MGRHHKDESVSPNSRLHLPVSPRFATHAEQNYTLDILGYDDRGNAKIVRFGGRFVSMDDAVAYGVAAREGRLTFVPSVMWIRDQTGEVVARTDL